MTRKELRPVLEDTSCDICGRTILKGERTENYLAPGGQRYIVCELCTDRAYQEGWIRESAHDELPASYPREQRRSLLARFRRRRGREEEPFEPLPEGEALPGEPGFEDAAEAPAAGIPTESYEPLEQQPADALAPGEEPVQPPPPPAEPAGTPVWRRRRDARHVRAVPTNAQVKVERALDLFNGSEHVRTIGGIARTLGEPWVSASPATEAPSEVSIVVAWELSWYRFRVDLGDADDPVTLLAKGQELDELPGAMREWNASALADGRLAIGVRS